MENIKRPVNIKNPEIDILLRAIPWVWERGDELAGANNNTCWGIRDAHRANLLKHAVEINPADSSELKTALEPSIGKPCNGIIILIMILRIRRAC